MCLTALLSTDTTRQIENKAKQTGKEEDRFMEAALHSLLTELEEEGRRNDEQEQERSKKMLNLEPDTARLLSIFVSSGRRTRLIEIGTSYCYSTIWLA